jgi:hypothetical protein
MGYALPSSALFMADFIREKFPAFILTGLFHPQDGVINPKYKFLNFLITIFFYKEKKALALNRDRCCHLALRLQLIFFQYFLQMRSIICEHKC